MAKFSFIATNYRLCPSTQYRGLCHVRSCGHYMANQEFRDFELQKDFLEFYWCISGNGIFEHKNETFALHSDEVCCYFPGEIHKIHTGSEKWNYYWMTLDGEGVPELIKLFQLRQKPWKAGQCPVELFEKIFQMLSFPNVYGMHCAALYAYEIFSIAVNGPFQKTSSQFEALIQEIENNYQAPDFSICATARKMGIHRSTLYRLFVSQTGLSPQTYLVTFRLKAALGRIIAGASVKTVAFDCGFSEPNYFTRLFRKRYGITPTEYRQRLGH